MSRLKDIVLRYRAEGHVRFDIPPSLCAPENTTRLVAELRRTEGVYRVDVSRRNGKLSIRYLPMVADFVSVIKALGAVVKALEASTPPDATGSNSLALRSAPWLRGFSDARPVRWVKEKFQEARETAAALKIVARRVASRPAPGRAPGELLINFLNDILLLYLIKVHWNLITRYWLRRPFEYRYQWLATFYLLFLLIRSRQARLR